MSNIQVQLRRGTTAQHSSFTGAQGELTVDTDKNALVLHDGATQGGIQVARESVVNVADYGAKGDGTTDDTSAIQNAIDTGAKTILFPEGVYKTTTSLNISSSASSDIILQGKGVTINFLPATELALLTNSKTDNTVLIEGITFNGNNSTRTVDRTSLGGDVDLSEAANIGLKDCTFQDMAAAAFVKLNVNNTASSSRVLIQNCLFKGGVEATTTTGDVSNYLGMRYAASPDVNMTWNILNNTFEGIVPSVTNHGIGGITIQGESSDIDATTGPKCRIDGNVFYNTGVDNGIGNNRIGAITVYRVAPYSVVTNNTVVVGYETGIDIHGSVGVLVSGNVLIDSPSGITYTARDATTELKNVAQGIISGNLIEGSEQAVTISGDANLGNTFEDMLVKGNIIKNCDRGLFVNELVGSLVINSNNFMDVSGTSASNDSQSISIFGDKDNSATKVDLHAVISSNSFDDNTSSIIVNGIESLNFSSNNLIDMSTSASNEHALVVSSVTDLIVSNSVFKNCEAFILINVSESANLNNNVFENPTNIRCIQFNGGEQTMVVNNIFNNCSNDVINYNALASGSRNVLHGNIFDSGATIRNASGETISYLGAAIGDTNLV